MWRHNGDVSGAMVRSLIDPVSISEAAAAMKPFLVDYNLSPRQFLALVGMYARVLANHMPDDPIGQNVASCFAEKVKEVVENA
jgi:hypothetical protein